LVTPGPETTRSFSRNNHNGLPSTNHGSLLCDYCHNRACILRGRSAKAAEADYRTLLIAMLKFETYSNSSPTRRYSKQQFYAWSLCQMRTCNGSKDRCLHLHGFNHKELITDVDRIPGAAAHLPYMPWERCDHLHAYSRLKHYITCKFRLYPSTQRPPHHTFSN